MNRFPVTVGLTALLAFFPAAILAGIGGGSRVNTYTEGRQGLPVVAEQVQGQDGEGNPIGGGFVVVWQSQEKNDRSYDDVYGRRYAVDGTPAGSEFRINTYTNDRQRDPSVAGLTNGGFIVTWHSRNQAGPLSMTDVYGQRYAADGSPEGSEFLVNTTTGGNQGPAAIAAFGNGEVVVAWLSIGSISGSIYGQRYGADGHAVGNEFRINQLPVMSASKGPGMAALSNGGFVSVWESDIDDRVLDTDYEISARRYDADGLPAGGEFRVNSATPGNQENPSVSALPNGGFLIAWSCDKKEIHARRYNADGRAAGSEFRVHAETVAEYRQFPWITVLSDGGFVVAWAWRAPWNIDHPSRPRYGHIYARRFTPDGNPRGNEFLVDNAKAGVNNGNPSATALAGGRFVVAWEGSSDVYIRAFDPAPYLLDAGIRAGGRFGFEVQWTAGRKAVLEVSDDLAGGVWTSLSTNTLPAWTMAFEVAVPENRPNRFYRVRSR